MTDPYQIVYDAIVAALKGEPTFYSASKVADRIWPGNFVHYGADGAIGKATDKSEWNGANDIDFPMAMLEEGQQTDVGYRGTVTFGMYKPGGPCSWIQQATIIYTLQIIGRDTRLVVPSALRFAAEVALLKLGPRLGTVNIVQNFGPLSCSSVKTDRNIPGNRMRRVMQLNIPVQFTFNGPSVIA